MTNSNNPRDTNTQILSEKKFEDRFYAALVHLHEQEHLKDGCFCTTEISGVYKFLLELLATEIQAAKISQMELLRWKYKELNDQSLDIEFVEAYNILMTEFQSPPIKHKEAER